MHRLEHIRTLGGKRLAVLVASKLCIKLGSIASLRLFYYRSVMHFHCLLIQTTLFHLCVEIVHIISLLRWKNAPVPFREYSNFSSLKRCSFCNFKSLLAIINWISCLHTFASTHFMIIWTVFDRATVLCKFIIRCTCWQNIQAQKKSQIYPGVWSLHHNRNITPVWSYNRDPQEPQENCAICGFNCWKFA